MPNQKFCNWFNDKTALNRCMDEGTFQHSQQHFGAIERMENRRDRRQVRKMRKAAMLRRLDIALVGACVLALATLLIHVII